MNERWTSGERESERKKANSQRDKIEETTNEKVEIQDEHTKTLDYVEKRKSVKNT